MKESIKAIMKIQQCTESEAKNIKSEIERQGLVDFNFTSYNKIEAACLRVCGKSTAEHAQNYSDLELAGPMTPLTAFELVAVRFGSELKSLDASRCYIEFKDGSEISF